MWDPAPCPGSSWGPALGAWRLSHWATRDAPAPVVRVVFLSDGVGSDSTPLSLLLERGRFPVCSGGEDCPHHLLKLQMAVGSGPGGQCSGLRPEASDNEVE